MSKNMNYYIRMLYSNLCAILALLFLSIALCGCVSVDREMRRSSSLIFQAIQNDDIDGVRLAIQRNEHIDFYDRYGRDPLFAAIQACNKEIVVELLNANVCVNHAVKNTGATALMFAASWGEINIVRELIKRGADTNALDLLGDGVLEHAAQGNLEAYVYCLEQGIQSSSADKFNRSLLHFAVQNTKDTRIAEYLLDNGADPNFRAEGLSGMTALALTMISGSPQSQAYYVNLLLQHGADTAQRSRNDNTTPLMVAAYSCSEEVVRSLLRFGSEVNALDNNGKTALHYAAQSGVSETVRILLEVGAKYIVDRFNRTPMDYARDSISAAEKMKIFQEYGLHD